MAGFGYWYPSKSSISSLMTRRKKIKIQFTKYLTVKCLKKNFFDSFLHLSAAKILEGMPNFHKLNTREIWVTLTVVTREEENHENLSETKKYSK